MHPIEIFSKRRVWSIWRRSMIWLTWRVSERTTDNTIIYYRPFVVRRSHSPRKPKTRGTRHRTHARFHVPKLILYLLCFNTTSLRRADDGRREQSKNRSAAPSVSWICHRGFKPFGQSVKPNRVECEIGKLRRRPVTRERSKWWRGWKTRERKHRLLSFVTDVSRQIPCVIA